LSTVRIILQSSIMAPKKARKVSAATPAAAADVDAEDPQSN
jgi:hypothetical protein